MCIRDSPRAGLIILVAFLIGFGVAAPLSGGANVAAFGSTLGRDATLTGRTETWAQLVPVVYSQPFLGSGFGSFWTDARRDFYEMSHGHNGYLDILLDLGAVGLVLCAALLLSCGRNLHATLSEDYDWASLGICFLIMALVYNVSESALNSLAEQMTAMVILVSLAIPAREVMQATDSAINPLGSSTTEHSITAQT